ncbi:NADP-dependent oxidoreductase, partial [Kineococcus glutinatus]|uniref:NADP-dependent oxidoreductase n=1 Tax=Kineococcus glutinatus TaxID=1070872 RepID=UPI0031E9F320
MRVVEVGEPGGPDVLRCVERPDPQPGPGEVLVRVAAATVNPTDLAAREGHAPGGVPEPPYVLGWDFAGTVERVGADVQQLTAGQDVVGMIPWYAAGGRYGAYAELIAVPQDWVLPRPEGLGAVEAATVPLNALTAAQFLQHLGLLEQPEPVRLLVTGASGAVGGFAVQLAVRAGHDVTAVAGSGDEGWVRALGATTVLPRDVDYAALEPFGFVLDAVPVGAPVFPAVAPGGSVITTRPVEQAPAAAGIRQQVELVREPLESRTSTLPGPASRTS